MECLSIFLHYLSCLCILGVRTLFFSAMLLSLLIYKVQLAKLCGITQHIVPVVRRKKLGSTGLMLSGSSKFFDLHPTVWSHEVTIAFKTVTIWERRYLSGTRRFTHQQFYNSAWFQNYHALLAAYKPIVLDWLLVHAVPLPPDSYKSYKRYIGSTISSLTFFFFFDTFHLAWLLLLLDALLS